MSANRNHEARSAPSSMAGPAPSIDISSGPSRVRPSAARQMKKRELDRKSQRMARDRIRTRMAYLEKVVEDFKQQDTSGHIAKLMDQVADLKKERDDQARVLQNITKITREYRDPKCLGDQISDSSAETTTDNKALEQKVQPSQTLTNSKVSEYEFIPDFSLAADPDLDILSPNLPECYYPDDLDIRSNLAYPFDIATNSPNDCLDLQPYRMDDSSATDSMIFNDLALVDTFNAPCHTWDPIIPRAGEACDCSAMMSVPTVYHNKKNLWLFANETLTLTKSNSLQAVIAREDETVTENVPIRAMLYGWDSVKDSLEGYPSWQALRRIDEELFSSCAKVERLAILLVMHRLLQYHANGSPERLSKVPPWYMKRPSQSVLAHSYAIDFFAWPGLRERFVFGQHRYCSNLFWDLFCSSLRVVWPFEFRDCYSRNVETDTFQISPTFEQRICDIRCWTMGPEIFKQYPEFYSDIVAFDHIPAAVSNRLPPGRRNMLSASDEQVADEDGPTLRSNGLYLV